MAQRSHPWDVTKARGKTRTISFETSEGTGMSVDVSPDGRWIVFDLLAQIYRMPIDGGRAVCLTQSSGIALNYHPRFSPDGRKIVFVSDRGGQDNVWIMNGDGSAPQPLAPDPNSRFTAPRWTPDGKNIIAVRHYPTALGMWRRNARLWILPVNRGAGRELAGSQTVQFYDPSVSPDGRFVYLFSALYTGNRFGTEVGQHLQRLELATGELTPVRAAPAIATGVVSDASSVPQTGPAELEAEISPDGRYLAFAKEMTGEVWTYRGHSYTPQTALSILDLKTGEERLVIKPVTNALTRAHAMYSLRKLPGYAWMPSGKEIVITVGGKLWRVNVQTQEAKEIPFTAQVSRVLSESPRSQITVPDAAFEVKFLEWPAGSPDGKQLAFVAIGQIWIMDLPNGEPRPLVPGTISKLQLAPAWSPDGKFIAYTDWDESERGRLWVIPSSGGQPRLLTDIAGEYIYPAWDPTGRWIVITRGPSAGNGSSATVSARINPWNVSGEWSFLKISANGSEPATLATVNSIQRAQIGPDSRLYYLYQESGGSRVRVPFPDEVAKRRFRYIRSVSASGQDQHDVARLPAVFEFTENAPAVSPDGTWIAFQAAQDIYVAPVAALAAGDGLSLVQTDPNIPDAARILVGSHGGIYPHWRDTSTVEFASGNRYLTYNVKTRETALVPVRLLVPRPVPHGSIALVGARVVTIEGDQVLQEATILIKGNRIACVGDCSTSGADRVLDIHGKTVIPGLVDVHEHSTDEPSGVVPFHRPASALELSYGITTILDPAPISASAFPLAEMTDAGLITGPRTFSTSEVVRDWGDHLEIESYEDATHIVDRRVDWGAISIKNYRLTRRDQQQMLLDAARKRGVTVTAEGGDLNLVLSMIMDGQTGWEHPLMNLPLYGDATHFIGAAGAVYSPTLQVAGHPWGAADYFRANANLLADSKYMNFFPKELLSNGRSTTRPLDEYSFPIIAEGLTDIIHSGGHGAMGEHGEQVGIGSHWEVWSYATAMTPIEALRTATLDGAYFIGLDREIGSIRPGKLADLIILDANPLDDIHNTTKIRYVMKDGHLYDGQTLRELWPENKPYGVRPWINADGSQARQD